MSYSERLAELKKTQGGPHTKLTKPTEAPSLPTKAHSVSSVGSHRGAPSVFHASGEGSDTSLGGTDASVTLDANGDPQAPCPSCDGGAYYLASGRWHCQHCAPPTEPPTRFVTVPGGVVHDGAPQDVDAVLAEAVAGTGVTVPALRGALDAGDLDDIAQGRIGVEALRASTVPAVREQGERPMAETTLAKTADEETYDALTDEQRQEVDAARECIRQANEAIEQLKTQGDAWRARYAALERKLAGRRREFDERLPKLREAYLEGRASFDDLADHHRDARVCADMELDLTKRELADTPEWRRLVNSRSARTATHYNHARCARRVLRRYGLTD